MAPAEEPLRGGNVGTGVVRVGGTVRRPAGPWSASVDALLLHLEGSGYEGTPRALGYDEQGRQVLSYVEGSAAPSPADIGLPQLGDVGRLVREYHDAVGSFVPPEGAVWNVAIKPDREELVCHNDLAPWNLVRGAGRLVFVDWDGAGPGSRLWDLAYACHGFVPLAPWGELTDSDAAERLRTLVDGYDLDGWGREGLAGLLARRVRSMYELLSRGHETGEEPWASLYARGHGEVWLADARYVELRASLWERALGIR